jgi:hypothetical protein
VAIDRLPGRIRYRTNIRLQRRFPGREIHRQTGKALKRCRVQLLFRRLMRWIPVGSSRFVPLVNFLVREIILEVVGQGVAAG